MNYIVIFLILMQIAILFRPTNNAQQRNFRKPTKKPSVVVECRLYSDFFKEYAYAKHRVLIFPYRWIFLWKEQNLQLNAHKTHFSDDDTSGVWYLEPVVDRVNTFYLRNKKYVLEYLRGSERYQEVFAHKNHDVFISKKSTTKKMTETTTKTKTLNEDEDDEAFEEDEFFMWRFEKVPDTHLYHIWNVKLDKPLYSRKEWFSFRSIFNTLLVGIWHEHETVSEQFDWLLRCRDQRLPEIRDLSYRVRDI